MAQESNEALFQRLEKLDKERTQGEWRFLNQKLRAAFSTIINEIRCGTKTIIFWTGFDASGLSKKENRANAAFIAAMPDAMRLLQVYREALIKLAKLGNAWDGEYGNSDGNLIAVEALNGTLERK